MKNPILCLLAFLTLGLPVLRGTPEKQPPNILFIYLDDFGWRDAGFMGSDFYESPHLDQLAAEGMVFTDNYACAANCAPSRASLLSGQYTPRHGILNVGTRPRGHAEHRRLEHIPGTDSLDSAIVTWAEALQAAGYRTGVYGKWHLGLRPEQQGFDDVVLRHDLDQFRAHLGVDGGYLADALTDHALRFIRDSGDQPWCVYLSHYAVHTPIQGKPELVPKYRSKPPGLLHDNAEMAAMIQAVDDGVGRIIEALEAWGLRENTVILFSSDNGGYGPGTDMYPLYGYKGNYYEGGIRVPLFFNWPGVTRPGTVSDEPVIGVDLYPTLLEIAGASPPEGQVLDGLSLVPLLTGERSRLTEEPRPLFWHFPAYLESYTVFGEQRDALFRSRPCSMIRLGDWKLHQYFEDGALELYNLAEDIGESRNLAEGEPEKTRQLLERLEAWREAVDAPVPKAPNPEFDPEAEAEAILEREARVLHGDFNSDPVTQMLRSQLRDESQGHWEIREEQLEEALQSAEAFLAYQAEKTAYLESVFNHFDRNTPLKPRVTGRLEGDGYRIEKVIFESQPGFHVTGNLYLPDTPGPHPGILMPCGHARSGKAGRTYQMASQLLARNGFVVLCYDPIGQGERSQSPDVDRGTAQHYGLGATTLLLGRSLAAWMVHDGVRALDYLASRPEVDPERLGCTGNSGGGNLTSFLMAYDPRIRAAAPGCFMTTLDRKHESPGPGDSEQNLHAQIREGFDLPDTILARAPLPTLILSATGDYVPIEGAWDAFRQAKRAYTLLGYPERIDLVEAPGGHGFSQRLREGAVRFMARWLQDREIAIVEERPFEVRDEAELACTPSGQVLDLPGARSLMDIDQAEARRLEAERAPPDRATIRRLTGMRSLADLPHPKMNWKDARRFTMQPQPGTLLPGHLWAGGENEPVLLLPDAGMSGSLQQARQLHQAGHPVMLLDLRGLGETASLVWRHPQTEAWIHHMLGTSLLTKRAEDVLVAARYLSRACDNRPVRVIAHGAAAPAALHAAALEPDRFGAVRLLDTPASWQERLGKKALDPQMDTVVYRAYAAYGWRDLADLAGIDPRPNLLLAISDDQSFPHTSFAGSKMVSTPAFDRVAREGVYFANACAGSPGCAPSRSAIVTGRHPWQNEQSGQHNSSWMKQHVPFVDLLEAHGYATGVTGKGVSPFRYADAPGHPQWRHGDAAGPRHSDIRYLPGTPGDERPASGISTVHYFANFQHFLNTVRGQRPFFFWYGAEEAHRVFEQDSWKRHGKRLEQAEVPEFLPDHPDVRGDLLDYAVEVEWFDEHLERMIAYLEALGELDRTVVLVTSDNGMAFPRAKANCYEYGIRVPFAVRWPERFPGGRTVTDPVGFVDIAPTFLELARTPPEGMLPITGGSLLPLLESTASGKLDTARTFVLAGRERHSSSRYQNQGYPQRAIRSSDYLLIWNQRPDRWPAGAPQRIEPGTEDTLLPLYGLDADGRHHSDWAFTDIDGCPTKAFLVENHLDPAIRPSFLAATAKRPEWELFDVRTDPDCLRNLADDPQHAATRQRLQEPLKQALLQTQDPRVTGPDPDIFDSYPRYARIREFPPPDHAPKPAPSPH